MQIKGNSIRTVFLTFDIDQQREGGEMGDTWKGRERGKRGERERKREREMRNTLADRQVERQTSRQNVYRNIQKFTLTRARAKTDGETDKLLRFLVFISRRYQIDK